MQVRGALRAAACVAACVQIMVVTAHAETGWPPESRPFPVLSISRNISASANNALVMKWRRAERQMHDDAVQLALCSSNAAGCGADVLKLKKIVDVARSRHGRALLGEINRAVNLAIRPVADMKKFGEIDRWVSPLETLASGSGDCEDYAILKLAALRAAGIAADDLRLLIVREAASPLSHAVVAARQGERWLILDNRRLTMVDVADSRYVPLAVMALMDGDVPDTAVMADITTPDVDRPVLFDAMPVLL